MFVDAGYTAVPGRQRTLNPAIITLMLAFFGVKATVVYTIFTFVFAVVMGVILDKAGFEKEIKNVSVKGGHQDGVC